LSTSLPWIRRLSSSKLLEPWRSSPDWLGPPSLLLRPPPLLLRPLSPRCRRDMVSSLRCSVSSGPLAASHPAAHAAGSPGRKRRPGSGTRLPEPASRLARRGRRVLAGEGVDQSLDGLLGLGLRGVLHQRDAVVA